MRRSSKLLLALAAYALRSSWKRRIMLVPVGLVLIYLTTQAPRLYLLRAGIEDTRRGPEAVFRVAFMLEGMHSGFVVIGALFAISLGAGLIGTGGRDREAVWILARPVRRSEFVVARWAAGVGAVFWYWLITAVFYELCIRILSSPLKINALALLSPFIVHCALLSFAILLGSLLGRVVGALLGVLVAVLAEISIAWASGTSAWEVALSRFWAYTWIPVRSLLRTSVPFGTARLDVDYVLGVVQCGAWTIIIILVLLGRFSRRAVT